MVFGSFAMLRRWGMKIVSESYIISHSSLLGSVLYMCNLVKLQTSAHGVYETSFGEPLSMVVVVSPRLKLKLQWCEVYS